MYVYSSSCNLFQEAGSGWLGVTDVKYCFLYTWQKNEANETMTFALQNGVGVAPDNTYLME
jgi:hypothetical protein